MKTERNTEGAIMNIGITVYPTYGGSGIVGSELGKELAARGHTVHFISSSLPTRLTELNERVRFHEVEMMTYPLFEHQPYTLALATKMSTVAETEKLDLLHVHYAIPHSISAILARESLGERLRLPVITTLHGTDITLVGADRSYLPITRYGIAQSDGVTAISHYLKQATIDTFHFDRITVIPNFVCATEYWRRDVPELRAQLAPAGELILVHVSNFRPVKRPIDCVEIFARVRQAGITRASRDGRRRQRARQRGAPGEVRSALQIIAPSWASSRPSPIIFRQPMCCCCLPSRNLLDWLRSKRWPAKCR
ncbi:MAG: N-acetyl-alpha-D-glucosaminyl L-malate synthase BshA [Pyrinomonadaceae bacterium]